MLAILDDRLPNVTTRGFGDTAADRLTGLIEALHEQDLDHLSDGALAEDLVTLRHGMDRLEAEFARRLRRFDAQHGYLSERAASLVSWLRIRCRMSPGAAAQRVDVARQLPHLPLTEHALVSGDIGFHHAAVIARCASEVGAEAVAPVEETLVEAARKLDPGRLRFVTRHLRHCVDPDGALADANADHARRFFNISESFDGVFFLNGKLDAEGGALVRAAIDALDTPVAHDDRASWQRRADALVELAKRQLQSGELPAVAGQRPHITVTTSAETLQRWPGAPAGEMSWAGPVVAETVRRLACDAAVTHLTVGPGGKPLDVGRAARTIPPAIRRALVTRDRGCRFPGCDRPPEWTDAHHLQHWADGGETRVDNLVLLCRRHHRMVHENAWRLSWAADGRLVAEPP
jgi:hypothetical protein